MTDVKSYSYYWSEQKWDFFEQLDITSLPDTADDTQSLALMMAGAALQLEQDRAATNLMNSAKKLAQDKDELKQFLQVALSVQLARARLAAGETEISLPRLQQAWAAFGALVVPLFYPFLCDQAERQLQQGDARAAIQIWQDIATVMQDETPEYVYQRMSYCYSVNQGDFGGSPEENRMEGDFHKHDLLELIHLQLQPAFYFEIGVDQGLSLARAKGQALGVDARPELDLMVNLPESAHILSMSSDAFFRTEADNWLTGKGLGAPDLAFIDGMHLFEFALRDFINLEKYAAPYALVCVDDIYPCHPVQAERRRKSGSWTGDIWKLIPVLQRYRPDLTLLMLPCATTGLLLIAGLDAKNRVLQDNNAAILQDFQTDLPLPDTILQRKGSIPSDHPAVSMLLGVLRQARQERAGYVQVQQQLMMLQPLLALAQRQPQLKEYSNALYQKQIVQSTAVTTLTLYWCTQHSPYQESCSLNQCYYLDGARYYFCFELPVIDALSALRLDIADRQGCFLLHRLELLSPSGELLWLFAPDQISNVSQLTISALPNGEYCLVSYGDDPQFELNLPDTLRVHLLGSSLNVELSATTWR